MQRESGRWQKARESAATRPAGVALTDETLKSINY
jgi:hypothetical protein